MNMRIVLEQVAFRAQQDDDPPANECNNVTLIVISKNAKKKSHYLRGITMDGRWTGGDTHSMQYFRSKGYTGIAYHSIQTRVRPDEAFNLTRNGTQFQLLELCAISVFLQL